MSLLSIHHRTIFLAFGLVGLVLLVGAGQEIGRADMTAAADPKNGDGHISFLPILQNSPPPPPNTLNIQPFVTGLTTDTVTEITHAGDERLFIVEREGRIRIVQPNGTILPTPFLDIAGPEVSIFNWEQGLLGLAFHPDYANNGYFFIHYTANPDETIRVMRYQVSGNPDIANPNSGILLMEISKPLDGNDEPSEVHNGGSMHFGSDGYLYIGLGDGGPDPWLGNPTPGDPENNSQRFDTLLGKMLRIDVDGNSADCGLAHYGIPPGNPFVDGPGQKCDEIWATGLRNPWKFSFDRLTGDMYIGDVGEWQREEIDFQPAGAAGLNYGWHCYEGNFNYVGQFPEIIEDCELPLSSYTFPIFDYEHTTSCSSVTGGYVYRGLAFPGLYGQYVFADFCTGRIWRTARNTAGIWQTVLLADFTIAISTLGEDANGELYVGSFMHNTIYRIVP
jgi:glucose/arabinose dehydrogenase